MFHMALHIGEDVGNVCVMFSKTLLKGDTFDLSHIFCS